MWLAQVCRTWRIKMCSLKKNPGENPALHTSITLFFWPSFVIPKSRLNHSFIASVCSRYQSLALTSETICQIVMKHDHNDHPMLGIWIYTLEMPYSMGVAKWGQKVRNLIFKWLLLIPPCWFDETGSKLSPSGRDLNIYFKRGWRVGGLVERLIRPK